MQSTNAAGCTTQEWDVLGQLTTVIDANGAVDRYSYDANGNLPMVTDALGRVTRTSWLGLRALKIKVQWPDGSFITLAYDDHYNLVRQSDTLGRNTEYSYDDQRVHIIVTDPKGGRQQLQWGALALLVAQTDCSDKTTRYSYDPRGHLHIVTNAASYQSTYTHTDMGQMLSLQLPDGSRSTRFTFNTRGQLTTRIDAEGRPITLAYDAAQRLQTLVNENGHTFEFSYDAADRLTHEIRVGGTQVEVEYDANGWPIAVTHYPGIGDELSPTPGQSTAGQTPEITQWGDGSGHLHQINYSQRDTQTPDAQAIHQLICDIERDSLHQETLRTQGKAQTRFAYDPVGRLSGTWSQSSSQVSQPFGPQDPGAGAWQQALASLQEPSTSSASRNLHGLLKAWRYDKVGELRASRHSLQGDSGHSYDATGRILQTQRAPLAGIRNPQQRPQAANETFGYDPAGNIQDSATQQAVQASTALSQRGYVRDNLVRVFEDKRYFYDGHGRLIKKLAGKHTDQRFTWDEENNLTQVTTTRRPGTEHQSSQTTRFDYDAIGRRVAKHDAFGTTVFIWEGMRLIEERRGASVISYVYEPGSYVPLARLDAQGETTEQGGLGTTDDARSQTTKTIATSADYISARGLKHHQSQQPAANDAEAQYWEALNAQAGAAQKTGTDAKLCDVYYFHTDQVGMPQELTNTQGQLVWQANYKTWGSTVSEEWEVKSLTGQQVHSLDQGDIPKAEEEKQQNLRFQGQYLDRDTGLHYNTFRYYDADMGRFICPDPIGLAGGINLGSYSPNPLSWIDPWGWSPCSVRETNGTKIFGKGQKDGTPGHNQFAEVIANKLAMSGKFKEVWLNRAYRTAGQGTSKNRPDILAVDKNGNVHSIEMASKTDMGSKLPTLSSRNNQAQKSLPAGTKGSTTVFGWPYDAKSIKIGLDGIIGGVK